MAQATGGPARVAKNTLLGRRFSSDVVCSDFVHCSIVSRTGVDVYPWPCLAASFHCQCEQLSDLDADIKREHDRCTSANIWVPRM